MFASVAVHGSVASVGFHITAALLGYLLGITRFFAIEHRQPLVALPGRYFPHDAGEAFEGKWLLVPFAAWLS